MPVCMMCGGDLNAAPAAGGWAALDTKQDNTRFCAACNAEVKSVFALECPECSAPLTPVGEPVEDIEAERQKFEQLVTQAHTPEPVAAPEPVMPEPVAMPELEPVMPEPVAIVPEPVAPPMPEPVAPMPEPEPVAPMPEPVAVAPMPEPVAPPMPEPVAPTPEPVREPVAAAASKPASPELPSFVDKHEPTPEPTPTRPEPPKQPEPVPAAKEGFFAKLLRALGLKK
ncbi:MAG TPA: hypothetical protein V6D23_04615 [Candidatus Obscuribacterales bacterium]